MTVDGRFVPSVPCVICAEHAPIKGLRCCDWIRPRPARIDIGELEAGDVVFNHGLSKSRYRVVALDAIRTLGCDVIEYRVKSRSEATRLVGEQRVFPGTTVWVERPLRCGNYACFRHMRELAADKLVCAECWPLQMELVKGAA